MTPLQEKLTRLGISCIMAVIVIFICGFVVLEIKMMTDGDASELFGDSVASLCQECHTNLNATTNITACNVCQKMRSNVYA